MLDVSGRILESRGNIRGAFGPNWALFVHLPGLITSLKVNQLASADSNWNQWGSIQSNDFKFPSV